VAYRMVSSMLTPGLGVTEKTGVEGHGKCRLKIVKSKVLWTENRKVGTNYEVWLPMLIPRSRVAYRIRSPKLGNWIGAYVSQLTDQWTANKKFSMPCCCHCQTGSDILIEFLHVPINIQPSGASHRSKCLHGGSIDSHAKCKVNYTPYDAVKIAYCFARLFNAQVTDN